MFSPREGYRGVEPSAEEGQAACWERHGQNNTAAGPSSSFRHPACWGGNAGGSRPAFSTGSRRSCTLSVDEDPRSRSHASSFLQPPARGIDGVMTACARVLTAPVRPFRWT